MSGRVLVICPTRFNEDELWPLLKVLYKTGYDFEVVSTRHLIKGEQKGKCFKVLRILDEIEDDCGFVGICLTAGHTEDVEAYWDNSKLLKLFKQFHQSGKAVGAICRSVPAMGEIIKYAQVSAFPSQKVKERLRILKADLRSVSLTVDNLIVTAENPTFATMWAEELCNVIAGKPPQYILKDSDFKPKGIERRMLPEVRNAIDEARGYKMVMIKDKRIPKP